MFDLTPFEYGKHHMASYDPFKEMESFEKNFFGKQSAAFKTDIRENDNEYILEAEIPGFEKEDIQAKVKDDCLTISAKHEENKDEKDKNDRYIRRERSFSSYVRRFDVRAVKTDEITASYQNGVLTLVLPKKTPGAESARKLDIQ